MSKDFFITVQKLNNKYDTFLANAIYSLQIYGIILSFQKKSSKNTLQTKKLSKTTTAAP
ncbi:MAG: hypothetical protein IKW85_05665 [Muribaculaceae bacterium]|nr:hypothetical protein [Muribaculaceae bacterium]